jgi:hypothetical protein
MKILEPEFGGIQPRQVIGEALKVADTFRCAVVYAITEDGTPVIYSSEIDIADLSFLTLLAQNHALAELNGWNDVE